MDQPGEVANSARGQLNRENNIPLSPCVPENLVSRDGFSRPVPRQPTHLYTQAESGAYLRDSSRVPQRRPFLKPPYTIGSVPSLSGHAMVLVTGCCGSLFGMSGSSISNLAFSSQRKNRTHLSRIRPLSRSSLPSSSRMHCDSTLFVFSSCTDFMFWKNTCWSLMRNCFSNSTTWRSKKQTTASLCTLFSQLHVFPTALCSFVSLVSIFGRCYDSCIKSVAAYSSASVWAPPLQPHPGLLRYRATRATALTVGFSPILYG